MKKPKHFILAIGRYYGWSNGIKLWRQRLNKRWRVAMFGKNVSHVQDHTKEIRG